MSLSEAGGQPEETTSFELASFSDRLVAYAIDALLFVAGFYGALFLIILAFGVPAHAWFRIIWIVFWVAAFLLYHARFAADGRQTVGKRLVGVRVCTADGENLNFSRSLLRALGYLPSSLVLNLGFLWALSNSERAAWHDLLAGTRVVERPGKGRLARILSLTAAWGLAGTFAAIWLWIYIGAPQFAQMKIVASAETGLHALAMLQEKHREETGTYASDLEALARIYGDKVQLNSNLSVIMDLETLSVRGDKDRYVLEARALDDEKTWVRLDGPSRKR